MRPTTCGWVSSAQVAQRVREHTPIYLEKEGECRETLSEHIQLTFLSDLEAPDPVHPVVYSPCSLDQHLLNNSCPLVQLTVPPVQCRVNGLHQG